MIDTHVRDIYEHDQATKIFNELIDNKRIHLSDLISLWELLDITQYYIDRSCRYISEFDIEEREEQRKKGIRPPSLMGKDDVIAGIIREEKLKINGGTRGKKRNKTIFRSYYAGRRQTKKYNRKTSNRIATCAVSTFSSKNNRKKKYIKTEKKRKRGRKII